MNPEFQRLLRLELTPMRLVAAPLLIGLWLVYVAGAGLAPTRVIEGAFWAIVLVTAFWGSRRTADCVASELRERTWDAQRLSGAGPATMTFGKLLGAPIGAWYVIALALILQIIVIATHDGAFGTRALLGFGVSFDTILAQFFGAFAVFAGAAFAAVAALAGQDRVRSFDTTLFQLIAVLSGVVIAALFFDLGFSPRGRMVEILGQTISTSLGLAITYAFFGVWAMIGFAHQMNKAFAARTTATPWVLFLGALALFISAWELQTPTAAMISAFAVAAYAAALIEPHRAVELGAWGRGLARLRPAALVSGPAWLYAWLAVIIVIAVNFDSIAGTLERTATFGSLRLADPVAAPIAFALFLLRDMGICVWAGLRAPDGRGLWTAALTIGALWFLPGALAQIMTSLEPLKFFLPVDSVSLVSAAVQVLIAFGAAIMARR